MAPQFIYTMRGLTRVYPPDREVLKGINLSFTIARAKGRGPAAAGVANYGWHEPSPWP